MIFISHNHIFKRKGSGNLTSSPTFIFLNFPTSFRKRGIWVSLSPKSLAILKVIPETCLRTLRYLNSFKKTPNRDERSCHCIHMEVQNKTCNSCCSLQLICYKWLLTPRPDVVENPASLGSNGVGKEPVCENVSRIYLKTNLNSDAL